MQIAAPVAQESENFGVDAVCVLLPQDVFPHHVCVGLLDFYCSPVLLPLFLPSAPPPLQSPPAIYRQRPPGHSLLRAPTSIASSVKRSCYIPPAASQDSLLRASTSMASSVKLSCYMFLSWWG